MEIKIVVPMDPTAIDIFNGMLSKPCAEDAFTNDSLIDTLSANLGNGYEVDIKIVNGDEQAGPYVDAVLFHNGHEVDCLAPAFERLDSDYVFTVSGNTFTVQIVPDANAI